MDDLKEALAATAEAAATHAKNAAERAARIEALEQRVSELEEALSEVVTLLEGWHRLNFADEIQQQGVRLAKRALAKARNEQVKQ
jgi:hypothetical protein